MIDTSERRIKMCEKAEEIQKAWVPAVGDYVWRKYSIFGEEIDKQVWTEDKRQEIILLHFKSDIEGYFIATNSKGEERIFNSIEDMHKATCIWLPLQHQLQEMLGEPSLCCLLGKFIKFVSEGDIMGEIGTIDGWSPILQNVTSMDQLWLAFCMSEKYNKVWNGKEWSKEV